MTPEQYGRFALEDIVADIEGLSFEKDTGQFVVPVFMSPEEYGNYVQDSKLPSR